MASWDQYVAAVTRGALAAVPPAGGLNAAAQRALDEAARKPGEDTVSILRDRGGGVLTPSEEATPAVVSEVQLLAMRAVEGLPDASRESIKMWFEALAVERDPAVVTERAKSIVSRLVRGLIRDAALGERLG